MKQDQTTRVFTGKTFGRRKPSSDMPQIDKWQVHKLRIGKLQIGTVQSSSPGSGD